jgi:amino acid permease
MLGNIISTLIEYVGVVSVVSIILSWFMMLLSWGDEEKVNKAKKWIVYSLIWVFVSLSSFWIIKIMDNLNIKIESKQTENQSN